MKIRVDHKLRLDPRELPPGVEGMINEALSIPNQTHQKMMEQDLFGWWDLPEKIELHNYFIDHVRNEHELVMPRGFGFNLIPGLQDLKISFCIEDNRVFNELPMRGNFIVLNPWQMKAVETIFLAQEGIWKAPAGSGKTVGILEAIRRISCRSIVLVNTKDILWQWVSRVKTFLGEDYPVGTIGDGVFEPSPYLTIATAQTLHSRFDALEEDGFFDQFSFVCLDECHHATAETYNRIVNRFSCRYRVGVSATPDKTGDFALATNVIGPIFHETKPDDVSILMKPEILKVPTQFYFPYRGTGRGKPSNYPQLVNALIRNDERNRLIARAIMLEEGHHCLAISKRLEHLARLQDMVEENEYECQILCLTGQESSAERKYVVETASENPCLIFSTLADEALDIPRLDRLFLAFPQRNSGLITQQAGRVERICEGKEDAKIYDFCDLKIGPLENQWKVRRREVYSPRGYTVTLLDL